MMKVVLAKGKVWFGRFIIWWQHSLHLTTLTNFSTKYLVMCKVYTDVCGIVRPVKRDWAVLSKDTPMDISI